MGKRNIIGTIFVILVFLGLLWMTYIAINEIYKGFLSFEYSETNGVINNSNIITDYSSDKGPSYGNNISYIYIVDNKNYRGSKICYSNFLSSEYIDSQFYKDKYPTGKEVKVYYNPNNVKDSILEKKVPISTFGWLIFILFFDYWIGSVSINTIFNKKIL